jgi:methyl-accepting chemotaxis protein
MAISTANLVDKVTGLSELSERLSSEVACASQDLSRIANQLANLTRGSRSGEEVTSEVKESVRALKNVASVISMVCRACDDYIRNAVS